MSGLTSYHAGLAAEEAVARHYQAFGMRLCARRWRGAGGEVDLIFEQDGGALIFVEVKKGRSFDAAAHRLGARQMARIRAAASEFLATRPGGRLTEARLDVALVDGSGHVRVIENAFGH